MTGYQTGPPEVQNKDDSPGKFAEPSQNLLQTSDNLSLPNSKPCRATSPSLTLSTEPPNNKRKPSTTKSLGHSQHKRARTDAIQDPIIAADVFEVGELDDQSVTDPVAYWTYEQHWPGNFVTINQVHGSSPTRRPSNPSYTESNRDEAIARAHSEAYEAVLALNGLYMDETKGQQFVNQKSKLLCWRLLEAQYPEPEYSPYPLAKFKDVLQRVQSHNDNILFRDITPRLVPSPELLFINGHQELEHIAEILRVEWTQVKPLCGPYPKPDQVIGPTHSAFNVEEMAKLENHTSFQRPTLFGENVYFPFLIIEAKCGEDGIKKADRQNMHSCSIALNAILELYLALDNGRNKAAALNGEILVFSISHDNERVKLFGHFAVVNLEKTSFHRYCIEEFVLNLEELQGRKKTHDFVRALYDVFYPIHLARIRKALTEMPDPPKVSMTSDMSVDEADSQELGEMEILKEQLNLVKGQLEEERKQRKKTEEEQKELMQMLKQLNAQVRELLQTRSVASTDD